MIREIIARAALGDALPGISSGVNVAVLVPLDDDPVWASELSWEVARAQALKGRRVVLADLSIDNPALDRGAAELPGPEGIVDTILFGTSLAHVSVRQDTRELYYVPSGTFPPNTTEVLRSERWADLSRGFRNDGSLLLLFTPPRILAELRLTPQAVFMLAKGVPSEHDKTVAHLAHLIPETIPAIAIVDQAAAPATESKPVVMPAPPGRPAGRRRPALWYAGMGLLALTIGFLVFVLTRQQAGTEPAGPDTATPGTADTTPVSGALTPERDSGISDAAGGPPETRTEQAATPTAIPAAPATPPAPAKSPTVAPDSLIYALQVSAFSRIGPAEQVRAALDSAGYQSYLTPVALPGRGIWYRVMVGAYADRESARRVRAGLWSTGRVKSGTGTVLRTPYGLVLGRGLPPDSATRLLRGLRQKGVSGYILRAPDGSASVVYGAFSNPGQAAAADSMLKARGFEAAIESRMGKSE